MSNALTLTAARLANLQRIAHFDHSNPLRVAAVAILDNKTAEVARIVRTLDDASLVEMVSVCDAVTGARKAIQTATRKRLQTLAG